MFSLPLVFACSLNFKNKYFLNSTNLHMPGDRSDTNVLTNFPLLLLPKNRNTSPFRIAWNIKSTSILLSKKIQLRTESLLKLHHLSFNHRIPLNTKRPTSPSSDGFSCSHVHEDAFSSFNVIFPTVKNGAITPIKQLLNPFLSVFNPLATRVFSPRTSSMKTNKAY